MKKIHVKPYTWDRGKWFEVEGVLVTRAHGGWVFVALDEIYSVADSLVDYAERREVDTGD